VTGGREPGGRGEAGAGDTGGADGDAGAGRGDAGSGDGDPSGLPLAGTARSAVNAANTSGTRRRMITRRLLYGWEAGLACELPESALRRCPAVTRLTTFDAAPGL